MISYKEHFDSSLIENAGIKEIKQLIQARLDHMLVLN